MNLYMLLEGKRSEAAIYPVWLASVSAPFSRLLRVDEVMGVTGRNFFSFSAEGYPSIVGSHLKNAVADVKKYYKYDWLVVALDVDEASADERIEEVERRAAEEGLDDCSTRLFVVPQTRCMESWLLGNPYLIGDAPPPYIADLRDFYDVRRGCPERMGFPRNWRNHAQFHFHYVREAFKAKRMRYTKRSPGDAATTSYFDALVRRCRAEPEHLQSFQRFLRFIESV